MITATMLKDFDDIPAGATVRVLSRWWLGQEGACVIHVLQDPREFTPRPQAWSIACGCPEDYLNYNKSEDGDGT